MGWFEALVLGFIQGITEFLPISSSAHLRISAEIFGWKDPGAAFTAVIQIGTEIAVITYFGKDIFRIIKKWLHSLPWINKERRASNNDPDVRMGWYVIIGTIPIAVIGVIFKSQIETAFRNLYLIAGMIAVFALVMGFADATSKRSKSLNQMSWRDGIIVGFAQSLSLIPGVSRSGGTITAGLLLGYKREAAARVSFLIAIPAVFAAGIYEIYSARAQISSLGWQPTLIATITAFVVGYGVIVGFLKLISRHSYVGFVWYRLILAILVVFLLLIGVLQAMPVKAI